jgi:hypothetical protein
MSTPATTSWPSRQGAAPCSSRSAHFSLHAETKNSESKRRLRLLVTINRAQRALREIEGSLDAYLGALGLNLFEPREFFIVEPVHFSDFLRGERRNI